RVFGVFRGPTWLRPVWRVGVGPRRRHEKSRLLFCESLRLFVAKNGSSPTRRRHALPAAAAGGEEAEQAADEQAAVGRGLGHGRDLVVPLRPLGVVAGPTRKNDLVERRRALHVEGRSDRAVGVDRKSTRLNSSHVKISYAVFC